LLDNFFPVRTGIVLNHVRGGGASFPALFPSIDAPAMNRHGGAVSSRFDVELSAPEGTIYYTLDGTDPRLPGGAISSAAVAASGPFRLVENSTVKARALRDGEWSALSEAFFTVNNSIFSPGDFNADGTADKADLAVLVLALQDPHAYEAAYGAPGSLAGDGDGDGDLDFDDIDDVLVVIGVARTAADAGEGQSAAPDRAESNRRTRKLGESTEGTITRRFQLDSVSAHEWRTQPDTRKLRA
jgi:hypothetical protein